MKKVYFKIIIPCYNSDYIEKCLGSVEDQKFKDFKIVIINDMAEDDTFERAKKFAKDYDNIILLDPQKKLYNGGARNVGIRYNVPSEYTLYLDNDDWLDSEDSLQALHDTAEENGKPDFIRLAYCHLAGEEKTYVYLTDDNPKDLVNSIYVAPWTKCIKTSLVVEFPENTLIEDVVQHIAQADNVETGAVCKTPITVWNRNNVNSCSRKENQATLQNGKRESSIYRNVADLMDLQCKHDYCEEHRKFRVEAYKNMVRTNDKDFM